MKYAYEVQPNGSKAFFPFRNESNRVQWIAANPAVRGVLHVNSKEVKAAVYPASVIPATHDQTPVPSEQGSPSSPKKEPLGSVRMSNTDPRRFLQLTTYKTFAEMAHAWSLVYNVNCHFPLYSRNVIHAVKVLAAYLDENGCPRVPKAIFTPDVVQQLAALSLIRVRKGFLEFTPGFLMDACLGPDNYEALHQLREEASKVAK